MSTGGLVGDRPVQEGMRVDHCLVVLFRELGSSFLQAVLSLRTPQGASRQGVLLPAPELLQLRYGLD